MCIRDRFERQLEGWGRKVTYHERLKESYYLVQQMWAGGVDAQELWREDDGANAAGESVGGSEGASAAEVHEVGEAGDAA